jgi:hypothetical protein
MRTLLLGINVGFDLWMDWYDRRLTGRVTGFDLPPEQDLELHCRLIAKKDNWWGRPAAKVNAEIKSWIEELASQELEPDAPTMSEISEPDPQEITAPQFKLEDDQRITINVSAGLEKLRTDDAARDRHQITREALGAVSRMLHGNNNAGHISEIADVIVAALGDSLEVSKPSLVVLHAETFRKALTLQQSAKPDADLRPLEGLQLLRVSTATNALNLMIGSDPFMDNMDRLLLGPDNRFNLPKPAQVIVIAESAKTGQVIDDIAHNGLIEAAKQAPDIPSPESRQSSLLGRFTLNFVRFGIEVLFTCPKETILSAAMMAGPAVVASGFHPGFGTVSAFVGFCFLLIRYFKLNEDRLREITGMSKLTRANFDQLMRILHRIPTKLKKDEKK